MPPSPGTLLESMEFITLTYFLSLSEEHLFGSAALQTRSQPLAGVGSQQRALLAQLWERKPLVLAWLAHQPLC